MGERLSAQQTQIVRHLGSESDNRCLFAYRELKNVDWPSDSPATNEAAWSDLDCWGCPMCFDRMEWTGTGGQR